MAAMAAMAASDRSNMWKAKLRPKGHRIEYPALRKMIENSVEYADRLLFGRGEPTATVDLIFAFHLGLQHLPAEYVYCYANRLRFASE